MQALDELTKEVINIGQVLLSYWPGSDTQNSNALNIEQKSDGSSVTAADYKANELLHIAINKYYPGVQIISEESPKPDTRPNQVWIIDPLDGTKSFIDGKNDFSILAALVEGTEVKQAIMHFPVLNVTAMAEKGKGAFIHGQPIKVTNFTKTREKSVYVRNLKFQHPSFFTERMDSGRAFLAVARGELDGTIMGMGRHNEWDLAAPTLVMEEAGGKVTDEHGNKVKFNQPNIYYQHFVASNSLVHAELLTLISTCD